MIVSPLFRLFLFIFTSCFLLLLSNNSFASCIKIEDNKFEFLPQDGTICVNKATSGILTLYSNPDISDTSGTNNLDTLIAGRSDSGYSIHLTFDRDGSTALSGDQILFAAYENMSGGVAIAKAGIRSGEFFYEIGSEPINSVNMNALNDVDVVNPHIAIIVYDERRQRVILNVDGAEVISDNINPITDISNISRIEFGEGYTGNMGMMYNYATRLSIQERIEIAGILANSTTAKIIKAKRDERGILVSGIDREDAIKCRPGKALINGNCQSAITTFSNKPNNVTYASNTIAYNPSYLGESNAANFTCNTGYQYDTNIPKYWFTLSGDTPAVHTSGDSCIEQTYTLGQDGNHSLPDNAIDPGTFTGSDLIGYTAESPRSISCAPRHSGQGNLGVYLDNGVLKAQGSCVYSSSNSPDCYDVSITPIGSIGAASGCAGMLVVDREMLNYAKGDNSYDFKPGDSYTSHSGATYTFANGSNNIFTGQITDMSWFFHSSSFNQDISNWDVSSVTNMTGMFNSSSFNQPIGNWDVGNVTSMNNMFQYNSAFNGDISNWDTSSVTNMGWMFTSSYAFNGDISNWDTSSVTDMGTMFAGTTAFNGDISNWDTSNVTNMNSMFYSSAFNGDISNWDTSKVTVMDNMFQFSAFNGDISNWDTSNVTSMNNMFYKNRAFNQDISNWDTSNVTNMGGMFYNSAFNNNSISNWDTSSATTMLRMFHSSAFNGDISNWDTSSVTHMGGMFYNNSAFNNNLSSWCVQSVTDYTYFNTQSVLSGANLPPFGTSTNCN